MSEPRYPKRKRAEVQYAPVDDDDDHHDDGDQPVDDVDSDDADDFDEGDEEWYINKRAKQKANKWKRFDEMHKASMKRQKAAAAKIAKRGSMPFRFMDLHPEIRNTTYQYILTNPSNFVAIDSMSLINGRLRRRLVELVHVSGQAPLRNLRLLRVCKQIYAEASGYLYSQKFHFKHLDSLQTYTLLVRRPETKAMLTNIHVMVHDNEWKIMPSVSEKLTGFTNLTSLKIEALHSKTVEGRDYCKYLGECGRSIDDYPVTLASWDKLIGMKRARDLYAFMYPYFQYYMENYKPTSGREVAQLGGAAQPNERVHKNKPAEKNTAAKQVDAAAAAATAAAKKELAEFLKEFPGLEKMFSIVEFDIHDEFRGPFSRPANPHTSAIPIWGFGWEGLIGNHFYDIKGQKPNDTNAEERKARQILGMAEKLSNYHKYKLG